MAKRWRQDVAERFQVASKAGRVMAEMLCFIVCYGEDGYAWMWGGKPVWHGYLPEECLVICCIKNRLRLLRDDTERQAT